MKRQFFLHTLFIAFFTIIAFEAKAQDPMELASKMFVRTKQIKGLKFNLLINQRINGQMVLQTAYMKIQRSPLKIYYKQSSGDAPEALYIDGANGNKAVVNPNAFPYINLNLDPYGSLMRSGQHHTIFDADFKYGVGVLEYLLTKYKRQANSLMKLDGTITFKGIDCYKVSLTNPNFKYNKYVVKKGETLTSIARREWLNDYMIMELNKLSSYTSVSEGNIVTLPNDYAKSMELYIDKSRYVPVLMKIYDDKGLYEQFEFSNIIIDPSFAADEFTTTFKDYSF
jgi:hypothetical protein